MRALRMLQVALLLSLILSAGCATQNMHQAERPSLLEPIIHQTEHSRLLEKLKEDKILGEKFINCTAHAYREIPLKEDEDAKALNELVDKITSREKVIDFHPHLIGLARVWELVKRFHNKIRLDEERMIKEGNRFERLLVAYNIAYFGNLKFEVEPTPGKDGIKGAIKMVADGFIDRNGNALIFPGLSSEVEISPGKMIRVEREIPDSKRVSSDLVRIFLEAVFDSAFRTPAARKATALAVDSKGGETPYPAFNADHPVSVDDFAKVTRAALRVESEVTSAVGKAVRGGGVFGTNNETLASVIETAAGVTGKKIAEHEAYCYYQVKSEGAGREK